MTENNKNSQEEIHTLSNEDFETFKKEFIKWVDIFGLRGWDITFKFEKLNNIYGSCTSNIVGRCATIALNNTMTKEQYSTHQVKKTAFHECCELFLARINGLANYRHTTEDEITEEIHNIIRTMEYIKENYQEVFKADILEKGILFPVSLDEFDVKKDCTTCSKNQTKPGYCTLHCKDYSAWEPIKTSFKRTCDNCFYSQVNCNKFVGSCDGFSKWTPLCKGVLDD